MVYHAVTILPRRDFDSWFPGGRTIRRRTVIPGPQDWTFADVLPYPPQGPVEMFAMGKFPPFVFPNRQGLLKKGGQVA